ncbi:hypothetical protein ASG17_05045 [Brevundimonas sp. Leaf363]|uniref:hypothetical protein n=1 Tax=Brevundimonas sp. Leaf363 TaxID=1736353 RepID=UPI0006FB0D19|nr:hypothetical protein [Brevundimonas sp. Leaf363]KQS55456.1 hypothetical protein ASG17_05045 [Brevundimonas sp. Leaf363]
MGAGGDGGVAGAAVCQTYVIWGLANLWRRRASEGWNRDKHRTPDPRPEPVEGWDRWGERRLESFETEREAQRLLALTLVEMLDRDTLEGAPMQAPTWHIGWLMTQRARRRPDLAEADRAWGMTRPWGACVWDEAGALRSQGEIDARFLRLWRQDWREEQGLPDGAAEAWPVAAEA